MLPFPPTLRPIRPSVHAVLGSDQVPPVIELGLPSPPHSLPILGGIYGVEWTQALDHRGRSIMPTH